MAGRGDGVRPCSVAEHEHGLVAPVVGGGVEAFPDAAVAATAAAGGGLGGRFAQGDALLGGLALEVGAITSTDPRLIWQAGSICAGSLFSGNFT